MNDKGRTGMSDKTISVDYDYGGTVIKGSITLSGKIEEWWINHIESAIRGVVDKAIADQITAQRGESVKVTDPS
jgi:hypothetical protein